MQGQNAKDKSNGSHCCNYCYLIVGLQYSSRALDVPRDVVVVVDTKWKHTSTLFRRIAVCNYCIVVWFLRIRYAVSYRQKITRSCVCFGDLSVWWFYAINLKLSKCTSQKALQANRLRIWNRQTVLSFLVDCQPTDKSVIASRHSRDFYGTHFVWSKLVTGNSIHEANNFLDADFFFRNPPTKRTPRKAHPSTEARTKKKQVFLWPLV